MRSVDCEGFTHAADLVVADWGCMITPAAADKAEHIRYSYS